MIERIKRLSLLQWSLIALGALALVFAPIAAIRETVSTEVSIDWPLVFSPWMQADAIATRAAIEAFEFSNPDGPGPDGLGPNGPYVWRMAFALVGILACAVVGPGLFVLVGTRRPLPGTGVEVSFQVGLALVVAGTITFGFGAIGPRLAMNQAYKENVRQQARDQMTERLSLIGQAAYQYYALPDSMSGGGGSFEGLSRTDLRRHLPGKMEEEDWQVDVSPLSTSLKEWEFEVKSDTLFEVRATRACPCPTGGSDSLRAILQTSPSEVADIRRGQKPGEQRRRKENSGSENTGGENTGSEGPKANSGG
ncbi:nucleoside 2-deoxyribosyltransferase [Salinibacter ruber]|uniref:nucleoside 2-deoxyribosyltransferase n=1 Tax=Salinibacter ruber TaxID=146919 RepID=UPI0021697239|nr:nucleoside 2-deoxyribosyltransferase [Salinibacter ruber]MCS4198459.1 hypothetical protein [Salinibacter ruber]